MKCPLCSTTARDGASECPSCGAIFAKVRERQEREKKLAEAALAETEALAAAAPASFSPWKLRAAAAALVIAWIVGFGLYYRAQLKKISGEPRRREPGREARFND